MERRWSWSPGGATKVAAVYLLFSASWVLLSDWALARAVSDPSQITALQTLKGLTFMVLSAGIVFLLVHREQRRLAETNADLERTVQHATVLHRLLRHNLRNSCDVIGNTVSLLEAGRGDPSANRDRIRRQSDRLTAIADKSEQLRDVVFDEDLRPVALDLATVVSEAVGQVRAEYPAATFDVSVREAVRAHAHPRLALAVRELLRNAVAHQDEAAPFVSVTLREEAEGVVLIVADDGPGLPTAEREVLERGIEHTLAHSSGVGLWLVRFTVTDSGGTIAVPASDDGTSVEIRLPRAGG